MKKNYFSLLLLLLISFFAFSFVRGDYVSLKVGDVTKTITVGTQSGVVVNNNMYYVTAISGDMAKIYVVYNNLNGTSSSGGSVYSLLINTPKTINNYVHVLLSITKTSNTTAGTTNGNELTNGNKVIEDVSSLDVQNITSWGKETFDYVGDVIKTYNVYSNYLSLGRGSNLLSLGLRTFFEIVPSTYRNVSWQAIRGVVNNSMERPFYIVNHSNYNLYIPYDQNIDCASYRSGKKAIASGYYSVYCGCSAWTQGDTGLYFDNMQSFTGYTHSGAFDCSVVSKKFTCVNGVWDSGDGSKTSDYMYSSCSDTKPCADWRIGSTTSFTHGSFVTGYMLPSAADCNSMAKGFLCDDGIWTGGNTAMYSNLSCITITIVTGACGGAVSNTYTSSPTTNLCSGGTATAVTTNSNTYTWNCSGANGGTTASCSATRLPVINGICGSASGLNFSAEPIDSQLCSTGVGIVKPVARASILYNASYSWTCNGTGGGANMTCDLNKVYPYYQYQCQLSGTVALKWGLVNYPNGSTSYSAIGTTYVNGDTIYASPTSTNAYYIGGYSCKANGACGTSNGQTFSTQPSSNLCNIGTNGAVSTSGNNYVWSCAGINGGTSASCSANKSTNATCGSANNNSYITEPTNTQLCGAFSVTKNYGVWNNLAENANANWSCAGINGGTNANCNATRVYYSRYQCQFSPGVGLVWQPVAGTNASSSSFVTYYLDDYIYASSSSASSYTCTCPASAPNFSITDGCTASPVPITGACGTSNNSSFTSYPSSNKCNSYSSITDSDTNGNDGYYNWTCNGANGGSTASCSATRLVVVNGSCNTTTTSSSYTSAPSSNLCSVGSPSGVSSYANSYDWYCYGANGGSDSYCSATRIYASAGTCNSATNGVATYSYPSSNLCSNYSSITNNDTNGNDGYYDWTCNGVNGGANTPCGAPKKTNGTCNSATNGVATYSYPSSNLCSNYSSITNNDTNGNDGYYNWTCVGINGGTDATCSASKKVDGKCGAASGNLYSDYTTGGVIAMATGAGLCNTAYGASTVTAGVVAGKLTWTCNGSGGGINQSCKADYNIKQQICNPMTIDSNCNKTKTYSFQEGIINSIVTQSYTDSVVGGSSTASKVQGTCKCVDNVCARDFGAETCGVASCTDSCSYVVTDVAGVKSCKAMTCTDPSIQELDRNTCNSSTATWSCKNIGACRYNTDCVSNLSCDSNGCAVISNGSKTNVCQGRNPNTSTCEAKDAYGGTCGGGSYGVQTCSSWKCQGYINGTWRDVNSSYCDGDGGLLPAFNGYTKQNFFVSIFVPSAYAILDDQGATAYRETCASYTTDYYSCSTITAGSTCTYKGCTRTSDSSVCKSYGTNGASCTANSKCSFKAGGEILGTCQEVDKYTCDSNGTWSRDSNYSCNIINNYQPNYLPGSSLCLTSQPSDSTCADCSFVCKGQGQVKRWNTGGSPAYRQYDTLYDTNYWGHSATEGGAPVECQKKYQAAKWADPTWWGPTRMADKVEYVNGKYIWVHYFCGFKGGFCIANCAEWKKRYEGSSGPDAYVSSACDSKTDQGSCTSVAGCRWEKQDYADCCTNDPGWSPSGDYCRYYDACNLVTTSRYYDSTISYCDFQNGVTYYPQGCFVAGTKVKLYDGSLVDIETVSTGAVLVGMDGSKNEVEKLFKIHYKRKLYSINGGKYFVSDTHPFLTTQGWKSFYPEGTKKENPDLLINKLDIGDVLLKDGGVETIYQLDWKYDDVYVYNFHLSGNGTYYADGYLVHNVAIEDAK